MNTVTPNRAQLDTVTVKPEIFGKEREFVRHGIQLRDPLAHESGIPSLCQGAPPPNPVLGILLHAVGAFFASTCHTPQKHVKRWSWQIYWLTRATIALALLVLAGAVRLLTYGNYPGDLAAK